MIYANCYMKGLNTTKAFLQGIVLLVLVACNPTVRKQKTDVVLPIIPQPKEVRVYEGTVVLDSMTEVAFSTDEQHKVANWFNKELKNLTGWSCRIGKASIGKA